MFAYLKRTVTALALVGTIGSASAFSLMGPYADWQIARIGYNPDDADMGGVMNIGEAYRWNVKTIYYAYDQSFLQYFGVQGTNAIEKAIAILNALPATSKMSSNLTEFPMETRRYNYRASALNLLDMKSVALSSLLGQMGLASPERYTWCLRSRDPINPAPTIQYTVIKRNFDPVTLLPSSYVNGTLYTYTIREYGPAPLYADAVELQVDPYQSAYSAVVSGAEGIEMASMLSAGEYYTGLTRDDVGGLRHIYGTTHPLEHWRVETLPPGTTGGTSTSPWYPAGTNNTYPIVDQALRPGVDKITFKTARFDSILGVFVAFTNSWTDTYVSNSVVRSQTVQRAVIEPDILFAAEDLGFKDNEPLLYERTETASWVDNDAINGSTTLPGPGVINGPIQLIFSKLGPYYVNTDRTGVDEGSSTYGYVWGSFDGTTNDPVIFPSGTSIQEYQMQLVSGDSPWYIANSNTGTNSSTVSTNGTSGGAVVY